MNLTQKNGLHRDAQCSPRTQKAPLFTVSINLETESGCVARAGLELPILLPQEDPQSQDHKALAITPGLLYDYNYFLKC